MLESALVDIHVRPPEAKAREAVVEEARIPPPSGVGSVKAEPVTRAGFSREYC